MSVRTSESPVGTDLSVPDVALTPLPRAWTSLPRAFIDTARTHASKVAMADSTGVSLTFGSALVRALDRIGLPAGPLNTRIETAGTCRVVQIE